MATFHARLHMHVTDGSRVPCSARDARYLALAPLRLAVSGGAGGATCPPLRHQCGVYCVYVGLHVVVGPAHVMAPAVAAALACGRLDLQRVRPRYQLVLRCVVHVHPHARQHARHAVEGRRAGQAQQCQTSARQRGWHAVVDAQDASSAGTDARTSTVDGRLSPRAAASDTAVHPIRLCPTTMTCVVGVSMWLARSARSSSVGPGARSGAGLRCRRHGPGQVGRT